METQTATNKKKTEEIKNGAAAATAKGPDVPEIDLGDTSGFETVSLDTDGFYTMEANGKLNPIRGLLLARVTQMQDGEPRQVYIVRLTRPCYAIRGKGDESEVFLAEAGMHLRMDVKAKLVQFAKFLPRRISGGVSASEIIFQPLKKVRLGGGKTMWTGTPKARELSPAEVKQHGLLAMAKLGEAPIRALPASTDGEDDDLPF